LRGLEPKIVNYFSGCGNPRCKLESVQRLGRSQPSSPSATGGEWIVRFAFEQDDGVACSSEVALVIVDDATEQARLVESL
jgi:hypothetical protein